MPKDVLAQQEKVAWADGLAFIAPIHFCAFPAILKGWIDRVWTLDFAFGLTSAGWHGDINGRIPLLHHQRALIMTPTIFDKNAYDDGIRDAIGKVTDDWAFRFPGIPDVEHVYFYAATSATPDLVKQYFRQAYQLGRDFERPSMGPGNPARPPDHLRALYHLTAAHPAKNASPAARSACLPDGQRRPSRISDGNGPVCFGAAGDDAGPGGLTRAAVRSWPGRAPGYSRGGLSVSWRWWKRKCWVG